MYGSDRHSVPTHLLRQQGRIQDLFFSLFVKFGGPPKGGEGC